MQTFSLLHRFRLKQKTVHVEHRSVVNHMKREFFVSKFFHETRSNYYYYYVSEEFSRYIWNKSSRKSEKILRRYAPTVNDLLVLFMNARRFSCNISFVFARKNRPFLRRIYDVPIIEVRKMLRLSPLCCYECGLCKRRPRDTARPKLLNMPFRGALDNLNSPHIAREKFDYEFVPRYCNIIPFLLNNMMNFAEISETRMERKLEKKNAKRFRRGKLRVCCNVTETTRFVSIKRDAFVSDRNGITSVVFLSSSCD